MCSIRRKLVQQNPRTDQKMTALSSRDFPHKSPEMVKTSRVRGCGFKVLGETLSLL